MSEQKADCGASFAHDPHGYRTERGKVKACDGAIDKRTHVRTHDPRKERDA